jgi:hypothetical protein
MQFVWLLLRWGGADSCEQGSEHSGVTNVGDLLSGWAVVSWIVLSDNVVLPLTMLVKCLILRIKFPINNTCTIHVCLRLVEWQPEGSQSSSEVLPTRYSKRALKGRVLPITLSAKAIMNTSCVSNGVFLSSRQNEMQVCCSLKSGVMKAQITLDVHNCNHLLWRNIEVYGYKTHCVMHKMMIPYHLVVEDVLLAAHSLHGKYGELLHVPSYGLNWWGTIYSSH